MLIGYMMKKKKTYKPKKVRRIDVKADKKNKKVEEKAAAPTPNVACCDGYFVEVKSLRHFSNLLNILLAGVRSNWAVLVAEAEHYGFMGDLMRIFDAPIQAGRCLCLVKNPEDGATDRVPLYEKN